MRNKRGLVCWCVSFPQFLDSTRLFLSLFIYTYLLLPLLGSPLGAYLDSSSLGTNFGLLMVGLHIEAGLGLLCFHDLSYPSIRMEEFERGCRAEEERCDDDERQSATGFGCVGSPPLLRSLFARSNTHFSDATPLSEIT